jgi:hypothetical protein
MRILFLLLLLSIGIHAKAQTFKDVFNPETEITWLGLDFTAIKIVGDEIIWDGKEANSMYTAWNELMFNEQEKYDMAKALQRDKVKFALDVTIAHNKLLNADTTVFVNSLPNTYTLKLSQIQEIVKGYDFLGNSGVGVMFIMEAFNKPVREGSLCITFINLNNKEVLFSTRMASVPAGFGLRNYWASIIYMAIKSIQSGSYKEWRRKAFKAK